MDNWSNVYLLKFSGKPGTSNTITPATTTESKSTATTDFNPGRTRPKWASDSTGRTGQPSDHFELAPADHGEQWRVKKEADVQRYVTFFLVDRTLSDFHEF